MYGWTPGCGRALLQEVVLSGERLEAPGLTLDEEAAGEAHLRADPRGEARAASNVLGPKRPAGARSHRRGGAAGCSEQDTALNKKTCGHGVLDHTSNSKRAQGYACENLGRGDPGKKKEKTKEGKGAHVTFPNLSTLV